MPENKYPNRIMKILREELNLDENDDSQDARVMKAFSKNEAFEKVLNYEGIIGYASWIKQLIFDVYGIKL